MKLFLLAALIFLAAPIKDKVLVVSKPVQKEIITKHKDYDRIFSFVRSADPKHSKQYAHTITSYIIRYSDKHKVPPTLTAAVGYVESRFRMSSRPCVGIMQVYMPTYIKYDKKTGLNPRKTEDNIHIGVRELARYYHKDRGKLASRGNNYQQFRLRYTLGRYNGCGPNGRYVHKTLSLYERLKKDRV